ncbi:redoxin domain-containing protein [Neobacillus rhizosphaerae]|uniref:redoxin domain-containing protein n=1 Tax=Neobacillus rhizosphaerae TaxID=2880965 RepID=UPI003D2C62A0
MNKKLLSVTIILLAVVIIVVNIWNSFQSEKNVKAPDIATEESSTNEDIPGADLSQTLEGNSAPDFTLSTLEGESVKLSDYKGKKVILNFWATWCPPCKEEMPHMQNFYEHNKETGIEIVAVNLTNLDNGKDAVETFAKVNRLTFSIPLDEKGTIGMQYQAFTIPTSYIIDSTGVITKKIVGPMDESMMANLTKDIK